MATVPARATDTDWAKRRRYAGLFCLLLPVLALTLRAVRQPTPVHGAALGNSSAISAPPMIAAADPVVARGKGFEIRRSDIEKIFASARANQAELSFPGQPRDAVLEFSPEARAQVLNQQIEMQLVLQKASDSDKKEGEKQGADAFAETLQALGSTAALEQRTTAAGMTPGELQRKFAEDATSQLALTHQLAIGVTDAEVRAFYEDNRESFDQPALARVRDLLLLTTVGYSSDPLPGEIVRAKRTQIERLLARLRAGEDFAALARQYSEDPLSKDKGGELPPFARERSALGAAAFSLRPNALSGVIETVEGYHLITLLEILPPKRADLTSASDSIRRALSNRKKKLLAPAYLSRLRAEAQVEILDSDMPAASAQPGAALQPPADRR